MGGFVRRDGFEVAVEGGVEARVGEVGLGEVGEAGSVEGVFEVLEGEGIVEDVGVGDGGGGLADLFQEGATIRALVRCSKHDEGGTRRKIYV